MTDNSAFKNDEIDLKTINTEEKGTVNNGFPEPYAGMPADMVRYYSEKPTYVWVRRGLVAALAALVAVLLSVSIATVATSAPCLEDWQESLIYQVYPRSFRDSDGDGFGDLRGIAEKLDYISELGTEYIWLNPIMNTTDYDMGYDISNFKTIFDKFGTMEDFQFMLDEIHKKSLKLIMDFVPNHSSNEHEWFLASSDPDHENFEIYKDFYVWAEKNTDPSYCNGQTVPNNWISFFGGSAWEYHPKRGMFYSAFKILMWRRNRFFGPKLHSKHLKNDQISAPNQIF